MGQRERLASRGIRFRSDLRFASSSHITCKPQVTMPTTHGESPMSQFVLSLLGYLVPTFVLGFVWHLKLFHEYYRELGIYRPDVIIPLGFLSMLIQGCVFASVYPRVMTAPDQVSSGLMFAAGAGLLSRTLTTLAVGAKHPNAWGRRFVVYETAVTATQV